MKIKELQKLLFTLGIACACSVGAQAQVSVPSTFKHISIDGSFNDWNGIPVAYTAAVGPSGAIQYQNIYVANDKTNLYVRVILYSARTNAFANSTDNIFIDADDNPTTGYHVSGVTGFGRAVNRNPVTTPVGNRQRTRPALMISSAGRSPLIALPPIDNRS